LDSTKAQGSVCGVCNIGRLVPGETTFNFEQNGQIMLVEHTPAFICGACHEDYFTESIRGQLIAKTKAIFGKSKCFFFGYQFSDLIRPTSFEYETFDRVRIKDDVDTWDMYDEDLEPGMEGTVIDKGLNPFDWLVEFRIGKGRTNIIRVEIDGDDLELLKRVGELTSKRMKAKSS
jgi:YgiT-type zinc finger domain-containing protein